MYSGHKGSHTVVIIISIVVYCQQLPLGNSPDSLKSQKTHQQPPLPLRSYLGLEPQRDRDGRDWGEGERGGLLSCLSPASGTLVPSPTHTRRGDFHNLGETLMPAITARMWGSLLADSTAIDPVNNPLVSSDYLLGRESLFSF